MAYGIYPSYMDFTRMDKLAVITGATSGIGAEFARQLAATHKVLWLIGRREQKLNQLAESLHAQYGSETHVMIMDLSDESVIEQLAQQLEEQAQLSILVNNAGYAEDGEYHKMDWHLHQDIMNVHVTATLKLSHAALKVMSESNLGTIINVSSVASFLPTPSSPLYGPTKAFIRSFSESLALKYEDRNIKIQALCPGFTTTDFHEKIGLDPDSFYKDRGIMRSWSSEFVVKKSLLDVEKGKIVSIPGWNYKLVVMLVRLLPISWILKMISGQEASHRYSK